MTSVFIDFNYILTTFGIITATIFISGLCTAKKKETCPVRAMSSSMRMAPVSDVLPSTRTAKDREDKKMKKSREDKSHKSSKKSKKKKKKSGDKSSKKSKKSKKTKKIDIIPKIFNRNEMDDDVKSTQRSDVDPKEAPPNPIPNDGTRTPKSVPPTQPTQNLPRARSEGKSKKGEMKTAPLSSPRSVPMKTSLEAKGVKSQPVF